MAYPEPELLDCILLPFEVLVIAVAFLVLTVYDLLNRAFKWVRRKVIGGDADAQ